MAKKQAQPVAEPKTAEYNPVRTGYDPRTDTAGNWLKLESGLPIDVVCLSDKQDIVVVDQVAIWRDEGNSPVWVYTGPNDPCHELGLEKERRYKAYMPVMHDGEPKIWGMSRTSHMQLLDIADAAGGLKGQVLQLKKTGSGLQTKYSIVQKGKRKDVSSVEEVDILSALGPLTRVGVIKLLEEKMSMPYADIVKKMNPSQGAQVGKESKPKIELPDADEDDDEIDDLTLA